MINRKWMDDLIEEIVCKTIDYEKGMKRKAKVCYMGKHTLILAKEYNDLLLANPPKKYTTINGLRIVEVIESAYLEVG